MTRLAEKTKRPVWVAPGQMVDGVTHFGAPVRYDWNWRSLTSGVDMMTFGPAYKDYRRAVTTNKDIENIKRFDKAWMDHAPASTSDPLASDAEFYVDSADPGPGGMAAVMFRRLNTDEG